LTDLAVLLADLDAESREVDALVVDLPPDRWAAPTPATGWTIAHQISHLAWTDDKAYLAVSEPESFIAQLEAAAVDPLGFVDAGAVEGTRQEPAVLLARWRQGRKALADALAAVPAGVKVPWYGPPMSPASMVTARLMETWAHGQDMFDALSIRREPTTRLRHIAHLGVRTRGFAYLVHGLEVPSGEIRVELIPPDGGEPWTWGPADAAERIIGPALDFCLLVTQRRHRADLALTAVGENADAWLDIAQAFAGPPGAGRKPGEFA
jgi:uncharacterized protein (TIGR03084 family)